MRIDPKVVVSPISPTSSERSEAAAARPAERPAGSTVVELSSAAKQADAPSPTVTARLEKIRELLDTGSYPVDLDKLAGSIVDDELARTRKAP